MPGYQEAIRNRGISLDRLYEQQTNELFFNPNLPSHGVDFGTPGNRRHGQFADPNDPNGTRNGTRGTAGTYVAGRGVASAGQELNGGIVADVNQLGIKFNTKTGEMDNVKARSGFNIKPVRYISHYRTTKDGGKKPVYAYAPIMERQAYNMKMGGVIGMGGKEEEGGFKKGVFKHDNTITYKNEEGETITEKKMPSYTKEGSRQRSLQRKEKGDKIKVANEIVGFQNEGNNLYDWLDKGKSIEDWEKGQKYLADKQGRVYEGGDIKDPEYWAEIAEQANTGVIADSRRAKEQAEKELNDRIEWEIGRKLSGIGDVDEATKQRLKEQVRERVQNDSKFTQQGAEIQRKYDEWLSKNRDKVGATGLAKYQTAQAKAARLEKARIKGEKELREAEALEGTIDQVRKDLAAKFPGQEFTDEQIMKQAKSLRNLDPYAQGVANRIMAMTISGEISKGAELDSTAGMFENLADAMSYWRKHLPAQVLNKQAKDLAIKSYGYTPEGAKDKVEMSDMLGYIMGRITDEEVTQETMEVMNNLAINSPAKYGTLMALKDREIELGRELSGAEQRDVVMRAQAAYNAEQGALAKELKPEEDTNILSKLQGTSPALYDKAYADARIAIETAGGMGMSYQDFLRESRANNEVKELTLYENSATGAKEPSKYVLEAIRALLQNNAGSQSQDTGESVSNELTDEWYTSF